LITDLMMPGGNGRALASRLRAAHPMVQVLFISGYYGESFDLSEFPGARFLQKPFGLDELHHVVAEMLAELTAK